MLEKRQNKKQVGENLFLPRRGPFCPWSANRESKLLTSGRSRGGVPCEGQTFLPRSSPLRDVSRGGNGPSAAMSEEKRLPFAGQGGGGRGDILYNGLYGEASAPPERGTFIRLQVYERVEILLVEVFKKGGKSVILVSERAQKD